MRLYICELESYIPQLAFSFRELDILFLVCLENEIYHHLALCAGTLQGDVKFQPTIKTCCPSDPP